MGCEVLEGGSLLGHNVFLLFNRKEIKGQSLFVWWWKVREFPHPMVATISMLTSHYLKRVDMGSVKTCGEKRHEIALEKAGEASPYGREVKKNQRFQ